MTPCHAMEQWFGVAGCGHCFHPLGRQFSGSKTRSFLWTCIVRSVVGRRRTARATAVYAGESTVTSKVRMLAASLASHNLVLVSPSV